MSSASAFWGFPWERSPLARSRAVRSRGICSRNGSSTQSNAMTRSLTSQKRPFSIDAIRIGVDGLSALGYLNLIVWLIPGMLGVAYRRGLLTGPAALALGVGMLVVNLALMWLGPWREPHRLRWFATGFLVVFIGIPVIYAPGNVDFYIKPTQIAAGDRPFDGRRFHIHNAALTAVRTNAKDLERLADHMVEFLGDARGPVRFYVPLKGFSNHDSTEGHLHDTSQPPLFADYVEKVMPRNVEVRRVDAHINDPLFADALTDAVRQMTRARATA